MTTQILDILLIILLLVDIFPYEGKVEKDTSKEEYEVIIKLLKELIKDKAVSLDIKDSDYQKPENY